MNVPVEYVWLGGVDPNYTAGALNYKKPYTLRSKIRILHIDTSSPIINLLLSDIPVWNYDGSSTNQAETKKSEIFIFPRALFNNPFVEGGYLVLCDTYLDCEGKEPHPTNSRAPAVEIFNKKLQEEPWFGIEQEFFLMSSDTHLPVHFDQAEEQGQYYCSVGNQNAFGRQLIDRIATYALDAGIRLSGWNAEVAPSQWEFQVGPLIGINAGDHLWMLRYIMERATEDTPYYIELHPKPIVCDDKWNGSGAHTNFSTESMRQTGGLGIIHNTIEKLSKRHKEHIQQYGEFNELRLSGKCETSSIEKFTSGIADRTASIRIPTEVAKNGCGYLEDRRPSSIMDPYKVTSLLFQTTIDE